MYIEEEDKDRRDFRLASDVMVESCEKVWLQQLSRKLGEENAGEHR